MAGDCEHMDRWRRPAETSFAIRPPSLLGFLGRSLKGDTYALSIDNGHGLQAQLLRDAIELRAAINTQ